MLHLPVITRLSEDVKTDDIGLCFIDESYQMIEPLYVLIPSTLSTNTFGEGFVFQTLYDKTRGPDIALC